MPLGLVITCEHASRSVPREYAGIFSAPAAQTALRSHRGVDPGALAVARALADMMGTPLHATKVSRLLIEPNRSLGHPSLFSAFTRDLSRTQKQQLISRFYTPHRMQVESALRRRLSKPNSLVLHVAIHSFTPVLAGKERRADLGLLYDPRRSRERSFASAWHKRLAQAAPALRIRKNYPYRGASDGFTTSLRETLGVRYLGFEVEINQALVATSRRAQRSTAALLSNTLAELL